MPRFITLIAIALVLSVSGGIGLATSSDEQPAPASVPGSGVPAPGQDLTGTIEALQGTLRRLPEDYTAWAGLAVAYVEQGRLTGVPSYYELATEAAERSLELQPEDNFSGLAASAAIAAARHDFSGALDLADQSLAINPLGLSALAIRVDALTELGRYRDQLKALRVADRRQPSTAIAARYAYAFELRGNLPRAASILESASRTGVRSDRSYLLTLYADIQRRLGRLPQARQALAVAREATPDYLPTRVSLARWYVAQGDLPRAVSLWEGIVAAQPLPEYLTELGELYLHLGRRADAQRQFDVVDATVTLLESGGVDTDLEAAVHEADHGSARRALDLASTEWGRRHSIHVADAYGWALHRVGRDEPRPRAGPTGDGAGDARRQVLDPPREHRGGAGDGPGGRPPPPARAVRRSRAVAVAARPGQRRPARTGRPSMRRVVVRLLAALGAVVACLALTAAPASAHPLGNFTVNLYTGILVSPDGVTVDHVMDLAEIPTAQLGDRIDDLPVLADRECTTSARGLALTASGSAVALTLDEASASTRVGEGGLPTTRISCTFSGAGGPRRRRDHVRGHQRARGGRLARGHRGR